jgi:hypothetical protein
MLRFLEREGYDVSYSTDVDTHERGPLLLKHKAFLSVGHDEYWSWQMRQNGPPQDLVVTDASSWIFQNTGIRDGAHLPGLLGYECDRMYSHHPSGDHRVAHSPFPGVDGRTFYSDMTWYEASSGSTVVATGTMNWSWGLDDFRWDHAVFTSPVVQQATRNILNQFGATGPADISMPPTTQAVFWEPASADAETSGAEAR